MRRLAGTLGLLLFVGAGAMAGVRLWGAAGTAYDALTSTTHIAPGLSPRLTADQAENITYGYLNQMRVLLADPAQHTTAFVAEAWAVSADQAAALDGCIPVGEGSAIVWVTRGRGDYLNPFDHAWSSAFRDGTDLATQACTAPASAGIVVIDDATGEILGVYPDSGSLNPHPSPSITLAPSG